jgi:hypothetical protein
MQVLEANGYHCILPGKRLGASLLSGELLRFVAKGFRWESGFFIALLANKLSESS